MAFTIEKQQLSARLSTELHTLVNNCFLQLQEQRGIVFASQSEALQALCNDWQQRVQANAPVIQPENIPENTISDSQRLLDFPDVESAQNYDQYIDAYIRQEKLEHTTTFCGAVCHALTKGYGTRFSIDAATMSALDGFQGTDPELETKDYNELTQLAVLKANSTPEKVEVEKQLPAGSVIVEMTSDHNKVLEAVTQNRNKKIISLNANRGSHEQIPIEKPGDTLRNCLFNPPYLFDEYADFFTGLTRSNIEDEENDD